MGRVNQETCPAGEDDAIGGYTEEKKGKRRKNMLAQLDAPYWARIR